ALAHWDTPQKPNLTKPDAPAVPNRMVDLAHKPTPEEFLVSYRVVPDEGTSIESIAEKLATESSTGTWTDVGTDPDKIAPFSPSRVAPGSARGSHRSGRAAFRHPALRPRVRYVR